MASNNTAKALAGDSPARVRERSYESPAIIALGTLAELTEGKDYGMRDDHDGYGSTPYV